MNVQTLTDIRSLKHVFSHTSDKNKSREAQEEMSGWSGG